ncbi:hypothetical protein ACX6XY_12375 [Streptomyces sp. O3]
MEESEQHSPGAGATLRRLAPPPALCGFLLLLALVFTVSYAYGSAVGPVAPGMRPGTSGSGSDGDGGSGGGSGHHGLRELGTPRVTLDGSVN